MTIARLLFARSWVAVCRRLVGVVALSTSVVAQPRNVEPGAFEVRVVEQPASFTVRD